ncbi:hypothetical protein V5279_26810 [Bradyrhizobium sp. 26S5]|uniref:hypothetical protein n=1 Tax=Bradyrhizobium sp. 26S5 TaxID=3139729 RepID=UPI0030D518EB
MIGEYSGTISKIVDRGMAQAPSHEDRPPDNGVTSGPEVTDDLNAEQREVLRQDAERWRRMSNGSHLDDWLAYIPGLQIRRSLAMRHAHTNTPIGKLYADEFAALMRADGLHTMDKRAVTAVLWLGEEPARLQWLQKIRNAMTPGQRSRLNSPHSARCRIEQILNAKTQQSKPTEEEAERLTPMEKLKTEIAEKDRKIGQLERAAKGGSLFDLRLDRADDIATGIVNAVSEHKAKQIAQGILAWFKEQKKQQRRPAG